ncbi:MAG: hypothetical protein E7329_08090 [Clostridiales bacterium]|nr:hypothetical protein [Clostridiales bacterium]
MQKKQPVISQRYDLMSIGALYSFLFCMMASSVLVSLPMLGGTLYLTFYVSMLLSRYRRAHLAELFPRAMRRTGNLLLVALLLALLGLMSVYPVSLAQADFWQLFGLVLCVMLRQALIRYSLEKSLVDGYRPMRKFWRLFWVQLLFLPPLMLFLLLSQPDVQISWSLVIGYVSSGLLECLSSGRARSHLSPPSAQVTQEQEALQGVHAFRMFRHVMLVCAAAVQVTHVLTYTYIAATADALIVCMVLALLCTYAAAWLANRLLSRFFSQDSDPSFLMLAGLVAWFYGLILFIRCLDTPASINAYVSLGLCTVGATVCFRMLGEMGDDMRRVAAFGIGRTPAKDWGLLLQAQVDYAALIGQLISLLGLILICAFTGPDFYGDGAALFRSFSPLLTLPALLLVVIALVFAFLFPMTKQHMEKLRRYMDLQKEGKENVPLHDQLEAVVVRRSLKHYGIKALLALIRPFYFHKICGKENVRLDEDAPCIFVCNHGEIYGPVVANLYVPFSFRPWSTYEMLDKAVVAERTLNGTMQGQKILPPALLKWLMEKIFAPALVWIMKSVDAIPVYHDHPLKLRKTFRETVAAMEAGDNILIFPENAYTEEDHKYVKEGVSEFFSGFTLVGQLYHHKTGKCVQFIPIYADKHKRTLTFGIPTRYDPSVPTAEESQRLCTYLRGEMLRVAGMKEK